jgi:hypothetical protein
MQIIRDSEGERVFEDCLCLLEVDPVFTKIVGRFVVIPLEEF